jgi:SnoaL-like domain
VGESNRDVLERWFAAVNANDVASASELWDENGVIHAAVFGEAHGIAEMPELFKPVKAGFPDAEQLSNVVDDAVEHRQAATLSSVISLSSLSSFVIWIPSLNFAPARTSATRWWPLNRRQRAWAASSSL